MGHTKGNCNDGMIHFSMIDLGDSLLQVIHRKHPALIGVVAIEPIIRPGSPIAEKVWN